MHLKVVLFISLLYFPLSAFSQKGSLKENQRIKDSLEIIDLDSTRIMTFWYQFKQKLHKKEISKLADLIDFEHMKGEFGFLLGYQRQKVTKNEFIKNYQFVFTKNVLADIKKEKFENFSIFPDYKAKTIAQFSVHVIACKETNGIGGRSLIFLFCSKKHSYQLCAIYAIGGSCH